MIPAKKLIAAAQRSGTKLDFLWKDSSDVGGLTQALELGVDALLVDAKAPAGLWEAVSRRQQKVVTLNVATWHTLKHPQLHQVVLDHTL
jgi:3-dehydroquinate synthase class II